MQHFEQIGLLHPSQINLDGPKIPNDKPHSRQFFGPFSVIRDLMFSMRSISLPTRCRSSISNSSLRFTTLRIASCSI